MKVFGSSVAARLVHRMCKHKQAFIDGDIEMLFDPSQATLLSEIRSWPQFKSLQKQLEAFSNQLREIETMQRELDKKGKQIKAEVGNGLSFGFRRQ